MNSKGQSLVVFVILMPLILLILTAIWEIGNLSVTESRYESELQNIIKYGLNNIEKENIEDTISNLIDINIGGEKEVKIEDSVITIHVRTEYKKAYTILKEKIYIDIAYKGYKEDGKNIIIKE